MKELVAYITSALPNKEFSLELIMELKSSGVDRVELGLPFSDPVADGPVIEEANLRSIEAGYKLSDAFWIMQHAATELPMYFMGYFNTFFNHSGGFEGFLQKASKLGAKGLIIPDLPHEEAKRYKTAFEQNSLSQISFVAVTDSDERVKQLLENSEEFIYLVAFAGITGADKKEDLSGVLKVIKSVTKTPVFVGFGVNEQTAKEKAAGADGVIVGSAFVKTLLDDSLSWAEKIQKICQSAKTIKELINEGNEVFHGSCTK